MDMLPLRFSMMAHGKGCCPNEELNARFDFLSAKNFESKEASKGRPSRVTWILLHCPSTYCLELTKLVLLMYAK